MADVYISPSVQHFNVGYGDYGTEEQRMNQLADALQYELERNGVTTARNNPDMTLAQVVADSNRVNPRFTSLCTLTLQTVRLAERKYTLTDSEDEVKVWLAICTITLSRLLPPPVSE